MSSPHIGALAETSLHADLKAWYAQAGDLLETPVDAFVIDIVRGEQLIEIQTGNFTAIRRKLQRLLDNHPITLVHPIARARWIVRQTAAGETLARRKSPARGRVEDVFWELVRIPGLLAHPNLTLEVLLIQEEQIWRDDGRGSWRRRHWSMYDRRLLAVLERATFVAPTDLLALLPPALPQPFTNQDLATALFCRPALAQKMTYCLRQLGVVEQVGKRGNAGLLQRVSSEASDKGRFRSSMI